MDARLETRINLFAENALIAKKGLAWQDDMIRKLIGLIYALEDRPVDVEAVRSSHARIKESTGVFSTFRGNMSYCLAALLSLAHDPGEQLSSILNVYDRMKAQGFRVSDYLAIAAYLIASRVKPERYDDAIGRAYAFYSGLKEEHRFITGHDDYAYAAMLGLSEADVGESLTRIENTFQELKRTFRDANSIQALSLVLVVGDASGEAVSSVIALREAFRKAKLRTNLAVLGLLALLPTETDQVVAQVVEAIGLLRTKKGFGQWSIGKEEALLYASSLVASTIGSSTARDVIPTLTTDFATLLIAQQAALMAIAASSAAVSASSANS